MATRFYLNTGTAGDLSLTQPLSGGGVWESNVSGLPSTRKIGTTALGTANNAAAPYGVSRTIGTGTNPNDILWFQGVSDALAAQTISGTVTGVACVREGNTSDNLFTQLAIFVVNSSGTRVATLWGGQSSGGTEANSPSANTRYLTRASSQTLSSYTCSAGDRIVIEIGMRTESTRTNAVGYMYLGDPGGSDLGASDGGSNNLTINPWVELSATLTWDTGATNKDGTVSATGGGVATVTATHNRKGSVSATGGGVASVAATTNRNVAPVATGGGVISSLATGDHNGSVAASGGGVAALVSTTERYGAIAATGGGVLTYAYTSSNLEAHDGTVSATGGGTASVVGEKGAEAVLAATGGGAAAASATTDRQVAPSATGGGTATLGRTSARFASLSATGGGTIALSYSVAFPVVAYGTVSATGGGQMHIRRPRAKASMNFPSVALEDHYEHPNGPDSPGWLA